MKGFTNTYYYFYDLSQKVAEEIKFIQAFFHVRFLFKCVLKKWCKIKYFERCADLNVVLQLSVVVLDKSSHPLDVQT